MSVEPLSIKERLQADPNWIELISGAPFWPLEPDAAAIDIEDLAWALSMQCRFAGRVRRFYSVAEHLVHVSRVVPITHARWGLLHDVSEAYLLDMLGPIKRMMPEYKTIEQRILRCVADRFALEWPIPPEIKAADNRVLATERAQLMHQTLHPWPFLGAIEPMPDLHLPCWSPEEARLQFLRRFDEVMTAF